MSIFDPFLEKMKLNDEEDDDEYMFEEEDNEEEEEEEDKKPVKEKRQPVARKRKQYKEAEEDEEEEVRPERPSRSVRSSRSNIVPMRNTGRSGMEVCLIKPTSFDDGREICDTLLSGCSVVINLEGIPTDVAQRIIDFTSGACYSLDGRIQKISNYIVIITPRSVELSGDFNSMISADGGIDVSNLI